MTEQEKQTRRARRTREQGRQALPTSKAAQSGADDSAEQEPRGAEAIKDRNKRLRDEAARKRASGRKRARAVAATEGLGTGERVDDALMRSADAVTSFFKKNVGWLQWVFFAGAAGSIAYLIVDYRAGLGAEKESHVIMEAVAAQQGRVADNDLWRSPDPNLIDPRPEFASDEARFDEAEQRFRAAIAETSKKGPQLFAHLGLAGVLFDRGKFADARAAYDDAVGLAETAALPDARGLALEGSALSLEAEGKRDEALKRFGALAEVEGFGHLGRYHQARIWHAQGESQKALETLTKVREALVKDTGPAERPRFLQASVEELMRSIDPNAVPAPGGEGITPEQLEQLQRQFEELQRRQQQLPPADTIPEEAAPEGAAPEGAGSEDEGNAPAAPQTAPAPAPPAKAPAPPTAPAAPQPPTPPAPATPTPAAPTPAAPTPTPPTPAAPSPAPPAESPAVPTPAAPTPPAPAPAAPEGTPAEGTP